MGCMNTPRTFHPSSPRRHRALRLALLLSMAATAAAAQEPLTLRQAIQQALGQNPEAAMARAGGQEAKAGASLARTQLLPQLNFTEDISRGNDPVYAFGMRLRQRQFTQSDFALNALNRPAPIGNFSTRFAGSWMAFDSFKTQKTIRGADLMRKSADSSVKAVDQKIVLDVVQAYQAVLYAEREIAVAQHEQETAAALLTSVDERVKAGLAVESDRMSAQVDVAARKQELIAAQGDLELAWAQLRVAMGAPQTMDAQVAESVASERFQTIILSSFGGAALLLAVLGIYGVLAYSVSLRTPEFGIRIALGSNRAGLARLVLIDALYPMLGGMALGLLAAAGATRWIRSMLYETSVVDPWAIGLSLAVLLLASVLASLVPLRKATSVDPMQALRTE